MIDINIGFSKISEILRNLENSLNFNYHIKNSKKFRITEFDWIFKRILKFGFGFYHVIDINIVDHQKFSKISENSISYVSKIHSISINNIFKIQNSKFRITDFESDWILKNIQVTKYWFFQDFRDISKHGKFTQFELIIVFKIHKISNNRYSNRILKNTHVIDIIILVFPRFPSLENSLNFN